jgi:putative transposase
MTYTPRIDQRVWGLTALARWSQASSSLSPDAKKRLAWFDYYRKTKNVAKTCRHFGISRKTFYFWKKRFDAHTLITLEAKSSAPIKKRQRMITALQEDRIIALRRRHLRYGKEKITRLYSALYHEHLSVWKVQKVIEKYGIYYQPAKVARTQQKRRSALKKKRIIELRKKQVSEFLICVDTIVIYWGGLKRYIFTGIDTVSKIAFARMYTTKSSYNGADFLMRLNLLLDHKILNVGHDNGSEFQKYFSEGCQKLGIAQYFSRPKTPKDNAVCERFNRTLKDEFLRMGNFAPEPDRFNRKLTEWLVEYNFRRPHQTHG